jgi:hypothetical protein
MEDVPHIDLRAKGLPTYVERRWEQALALRDACLGWLPFGGLLARLADPFARRWLRRSGSPFPDDISAIARSLGRPGVWLLHGACASGCTALADDGPDGLRRTLAWPFPSLGRLVEVVHQRGPAGDFLNVTWRGEGTPVENNHHRVAAMAACTGRHPPDLEWATPPVVKACTRLAVEMCAAAGRLVVAGWEETGRVTAVTKAGP